MAISLTVGSNTWVTLAEANSYMAEKFGGDTWASLPDNTKKQLLVSAYRWINRVYTINVPGAPYPDSLKYAQIELAWYMYNYWTEHEKRSALQSQGVDEFTIGKFSETFSGEAELPKIVDNLLGDYKVGEYFPVVTRDMD